MWKPTIPLLAASLTCLMLGGCGSSSSSSTPTTPVTPLNVSGTWNGSYEATSGVARLSRSDAGSALGCTLALNLPAVLGAAQTAAPGTRTVTFSIAFIQTNGALIGSYVDTNGRYGTVSGTVNGTQVQVTVSFFVGATGRLDLSGTVAASEGSTTQAGIADRDHDGGEGFQLEIRRAGDVYTLLSAFGATTGPNLLNQTFTRTSTGAVLTWRNPDFGHGDTRSLLWQQEYWSPLGGGSVIKVEGHDGGTGSTPVWSDSIASTQYWNRVPGPRLPTLSATSAVLAYDLSATTPPLAADLTRVSATYAAGTVTITLDLKGAPDPAYVYEFNLWDQVRDADESTAPLVRGNLRWNTGSNAWDAIMARQIGFGSKTPIASGASIAPTASGITITLTRAAWAAATGRTPTGGSFKLWIHDRTDDSSNAAFWAGMRDMSPTCSFVLPSNDPANGILLDRTDPSGDVTIPGSADITRALITADATTVSGTITFAGPIPQGLVPGKQDCRVDLLFGVHGTTEPDWQTEFMLRQSASTIEQHVIATPGPAGDSTVANSTLTWSSNAVSFTLPRSALPNAAGLVMVEVFYYNSDADSAPPPPARNRSAPPTTTRSAPMRTPSSRPR